LFKAAYYSQSSRVFVEYFCSDMSHRPSKVNNENMHCRGLLKSLNQKTKVNKAQKRCHGLLKKPTEDYKTNSKLFNIHVGKLPENLPKMTLQRQNTSNAKKPGEPGF
jgi:hypothetical protein